MPDFPLQSNPVNVANIMKDDPAAMPFGTMGGTMPFMDGMMPFGGMDDRRVFHHFHHHFHHHFFHFPFGFSPFMFRG